jgi:hypothetical protein
MIWRFSVELQSSALMKNVNSQKSPQRSKTDFEKSRKLVDLPNDFNLILWPWDQDDSVGLQALPFSPSQKSFRALVPVDQLAP